MSAFTAEQLDLSRLPPFQLVAVDEDAERLALVAGIKARYEAHGVPFDVDGLRTDPAIIVSEEYAFRKTIDLARLNDAGRRLSLSYGYGAALDHIAATYYADVGLRRLPLAENPRPYPTAPSDWESDARLKGRMVLAPERRTPGTLGGYEYVAMTAAPFLIEALALNHASGLVRQGQILVVLLGRDPDPNPATAEPAKEEPAQVALATAALRDRSSALGSDEVLIRVARRVPVTRGFTLALRRGPDPALVVAEARRRYLESVRYDADDPERRRLGKPLRDAAEKAALFLGAEDVRAAPGQTDVDPGIDGVVRVDGLTLTPEVIGG